MTWVFRPGLIDLRCFRLFFSAASVHPLSLERFEPSCPTLGSGTSLRLSVWIPCTAIAHLPRSLTGNISPSRPDSPPIFLSFPLSTGNHIRLLTAPRAWLKLRVKRLLSSLWFWQGLRSQVSRRVIRERYRGPKLMYSRSES